MFTPQSNTTLTLLLKVNSTQTYIALNPIDNMADKVDTSVNADSMTNAQGEFAPKVPPSEPLQTSGVSLSFTSQVTLHTNDRPAPARPISRQRRRPRIHRQGPTCRQCPSLQDFSTQPHRRDPRSSQQPRRRRHSNICSRHYWRCHLGGRTHRHRPPRIWTD